MVKIINVLFQTGNLFFLFCNYLFNRLDTFNRLLQALQVIYLTSNPRYDMRVGVAKLIGQSVHHLFIFMIGM